MHRSSEPLLSYNPELHRTLRRNLDAQQKVERLAILIAAQLNQQNTNAPRCVQSNGNEDMSDDGLDKSINGRRANNIAPANQNQRARGRGFQ
ncbi:hypothetical protein FXO38_36598 [Capsicum annuum]|nr:hypothetical protein FXO38_36598 [Capsicum annuum]